MHSKESAQSVKDLSNVIQIHEAQIHDHLGEMVRLRHIAGTQWGLKRYMNMDRLKEHKREQQEKQEGQAG